MVKSAVRAMDAVEQCVEREWSHKVETFTVTGASKRGWTTWLTGAVDPRVTAAKVAEHPRQESRGHAGRCAEPHLAALQAVRGCRLLANALVTGEHLAGMEKDTLAHGSRDGTAAVTAQQGDPEFFLQPSDRVADAGLRDGKAVGRFTEAVGFHHGHQRTELRERHVKCLAP